MALCNIKYCNEKLSEGIVVKLYFFSRGHFLQQLINNEPEPFVLI